MIKYNLTKAELRDLKKACIYMKLSYEAQAARPETARWLLIRYHNDLAAGLCA